MHNLSQNWLWLQAFALIIQWFILLFKFALSGHYSYFGLRQSTEILSSMSCYVSIKQPWMIFVCLLTDFLAYVTTDIMVCIDFMD